MEVADTTNTVFSFITWLQVASDIVAYAFILRAVYGLVILAISYESFKLANLLNQKGRLGRFSNTMGIVFLVYGIARILVAYPDVFLGGLLSNVVNILAMGWFAYTIHMRNNRLKIITKDLRGSARASKIIDSIITDLRNTQSD